MTTARHGTQARYKSGCRCQPCKSATARAANVYRLRTMRQGPQTTDATGARRRILALGLIGWGTAHIAKLSGVNHRQVQRILLGETTRVRADTADAIRSAYDRLSMTLAPTSTPAERFRASHAKRAARMHDAFPPLAWDDETIDDPTAQPNVGEQVASYYSTGRPSEHTAEDVADVLSWDSLATAAGVAERLGTSTKALLKALDRAGRDDLRDQLNRNARLAGHPVDEQIATRRRTA